MLKSNTILEELSLNGVGYIKDLVPGLLNAKNLST